MFLVRDLISFMCKCNFYTTQFLLYRLKQKVVELQTFKQQCGDLEQKVANFMQEKEQFENEVSC